MRSRASRAIDRSTTTDAALDDDRERVDDGRADGRVCVYPYTYHRSRPITKTFLSHDLDVYPPIRPEPRLHESRLVDDPLTPARRGVESRDGTTADVAPSTRARAREGDARGETVDVRVARPLVWVIFLLVDESGGRVVVKARTAARGGGDDTRARVVGRCGRRR